MDPAVSFSSFPHISCTSLGAPQAQICPENTLFDTKLWRTSGVSRVSDPSEKDWGQGARKPKAETLCATWELDGVHCQSWWISHSFLFLFVQLLSPHLHTWDACRFAKYQMKVELVAIAHHLPSFQSYKYIKKYIKKKCKIVKIWCAVPCPVNHMGKFQWSLLFQDAHLFSASSRSIYNPIGDVSAYLQNAI